jgi:ribosomal protein S12 methylthiotransferase
MNLQVQPQSNGRAAEAASERPRVGIVTLGCDKNTVDNEYLAGMIEASGCEVVTAADGLPMDAAVVTTCGFIASAKAQSIEAIVELAERKRETGSPRRLYVAGCLSQRYGDEMMKEIPEIDGLVGVGQMKQLAGMIAAAAREEAEAAGRFIEVAPSPTVDIYEHLKRRPLENTAHAFLKVSDGCNHTCSFCAIPSMKGKLRSVEPEILLAEARDLLARGVKEINLVAQDLSDYGRDRWKDYRLPELIRDVCALEGDFWVRCLYYYPGNITEKFLETIAAEPKVVPYLEMPLQHLHPDTLRRMKRPFYSVNTFEAIERIRAAVPGIAIRSTCIVGFPGETQKEFQYLLDGIERIGFDRLGAFEYSPEEGTPAEAMDAQVPGRTKAQRYRMVMSRQAKISEKAMKARKGRTERVLVERYDEASGQWVGRSAYDAPNIDGNVYLPGEAAVKAGEFADVKIVKTTTYDAFGRIEAGAGAR